MLVKIYVVDDDPVDRMIFEKHIQKVCNEQFYTIKTSQQNSEENSSFPRLEYKIDSEGQSARDVMEQPLEQIQVKVSCFSTASAALAQIRTLFLKGDFDTLPDLIFLDMVLPQMDGWEFIKKLADLLIAIPGYNNVKSKLGIYLLTSFVNQFDLQKANTTPLIKDYLLKPILANDICSILHDYLRAKQK
ncbi:response regulator [Xanthocytophaga flava]|uniref:response regulator n=1 Tax=Xanthocytophaga flava TaxID=3048013 RepID=UPI0028D7083C|nr:response regulator [Xanthocytophaga flavus]MDJ1471113.1 response regulator [Xanthocytophaga flavus]